MNRGGTVILAALTWAGPTAIRPGFAADAGHLVPAGSAALVLLGLLFAGIVLCYRLRASRDRISALEKEADGLAVLLGEQRHETGRLRWVLDSLPLPVWWRRSDRSVEGRNRAAVALDGPSPERAGGRRARAIDPDLANRAAKTGVAQFESRHFVVDGSRQLLEITETPPESAGAVGFARDVTVLESVQTEFAEHVSAHNDVLENLASAIAIFGPDRRLKFFNTAFTRLWRVEAARIRDEPTYSEFLDTLRELRRLPEIVDFPAYKQEQDALFTSLIEPAESMMHLPDNRTLRLVTAPHPFGGLLFVYEDVTDRLTLERSYNTLVAVQRETLNNFREGVAVYGQDGRLRLWNPALIELWGFSEFDLQGEPRVGDLIDLVRHYFKPDADWDRLRQTLILQVAEPNPLFGRLERTDGSVLQYAIVPLPDGGCLVTYLDVTDSTRVQRALEDRNAALEQADKLKTEFVARMSYELRTPLNAIQGFSELLLREEGVGALAGRQREYLTDIRSATSQLLVLIDNVLDYAALEAGYLEVKRQPTDLAPLLRDETDQAGPAIEARGLTLSFECADDIGPVVVDPQRFRQVLRNLLSNAMKFTPVGGTVAVAAHRDNGQVLLTVSDTGVGFDDDNQDRLFERFEVGDARGSGVGLGLALARSLIELHGGEIWLSSKSGEGTVATCRIPVSPPPGGTTRPAGDDGRDPDEMSGAEC